MSMRMLMLRREPVAAGTSVAAGLCLALLARRRQLKSQASSSKHLPKRLAAAGDVLDEQPEAPMCLLTIALMWANTQGVEVDAHIPALLRGYKRSFCCKSNVYRGTGEQPGLVLGLDEDGAGTASGLVLRIRCAHAWHRPAML